MCGPTTAAAKQLAVGGLGDIIPLLSHRGNMMHNNRQINERFAGAVGIIGLCIFLGTTCAEVFGQSAGLAIDPVDRGDDVRLASKNKPASNSTKIEFKLKVAGRASLGVFDRASGRLVRTLLRGERLSAGVHTSSWDGLDDRGGADALHRR